MEIQKRIFSIEAQIALRADSSLIRIVDNRDVRMDT